MKHSLALQTAVFTVLFLVACNGGEKSNSDANSTLKEIKTEMKGLQSYIMTAITTVKEQGIDVKSTMTIWYDKKKDKTATEMDMTMVSAGFSQSTKTLSIEDGEWLYIVDLNNKTGSKMPITEKDDEIFDFELQEDEVTLKQKIEEDGGRVVGTETLLGRKCIVVETVDEDEEEGSITTKMWLYKGMPLKMISNTMTMEVTKLEENVSIPNDKFKVPSDVTIR